MIKSNDAREKWLDAIIHIQLTNYSIVNISDRPTLRQYLKGVGQQLTRQ